MAAPWTVGSIVARLHLDTNPFFRGLSMALERIRDFGHATSRVFHGLMSPIRATAGAFGWIERQVFSLKSILLAVAGIKFIGLAGDAEDLANAFGHLQKSIGLTADNTLKAMREAMKGTVSDMDLMREANNALLLGAAKTTEEFALLAEAGRRLGKATGRDPLQGIQDLTTGIGRMSYRILDNLGLIVRAQEAYDRYKTKLNIVGRELRLTEMRLAFQTAAYEQIREKLDQLGPDTITFSDTIRRLRASITNLLVTVALELRPVMSSIATWITNLVEEKGPQITAFVALVQEAIFVVWDAIGRLWDRLRGGETSVGEIMAAWGESLWTYVAGPFVNLLVAVVNFVVDTFFAAFGKAFDNKWNGFLGDVEDKINDFLVKIGAVTEVEMFGGFMKKRIGGVEIAGLPAPVKTRQQDIEEQRVRVMLLEASFISLQQAAGNALKGIGKAVRSTAIEALGYGWVVEAEKRVREKAEAMQKAGEKAAKGAGDAVKEEIGSARLVVDDLDDTWQKFLSHVEQLRISAITEGMEDFRKKLFELKELMLRVDTATMAPLTRLRYWESAAAGFGEIAKGEVARQGKLIEQERKRIDESLSKTRLERRTAGMSERAKAIEEVEEDYRRALAEAPGIDKSVFRKEYDELKEAATAEIKDAAEREKVLAAIEEQYQKRVEGLRDVDRDALRKRFDEMKREQVLLLEETKARAAWKGLGETLTDTVAGGIARGLAEGKKFSEVWADVTGSLFKKALDDAIRSLSETVSDTLANIMKAIGAGAGWAGLGTGLLGLAGVILGQLKGRGESTVEDFADQVNSSEAIRGVVAGPTNVAISKVGDSLKTALRTTEILLERIARGVEAGGPAAGGAGMPRGTAYPLTAPTMS